MENNFNRLAREGIQNKMDKLIEQRENLNIQIAELEKAKVCKQLAETIHNYRIEEREKSEERRRRMYGKK